MAIDKASIFQCSILTGLRIPLEASKILHGSSGLCWCAGSHCTLQLQVMAVLLLPSHLYNPFAMPEIPTVTFRISLCQREALLSVWYSVMTAVFSCYFIKKKKPNTLSVIWHKLWQHVLQKFRCYQGQLSIPSAKNSFPRAESAEENTHPVPSSLRAKPSFSWNLSGPDFLMIGSSSD